MKIRQIEAVGDFLKYYRADLEYIKMFQDFKSGNISVSEYIKKGEGTFYSFLIEFKVIRNMVKGSVGELINETTSFISKSQFNNVDAFAERLVSTGITRGKTTTSLASKVLFLNNPWEILPMDSRARKALRQSENKYVIFKSNLENFSLSNHDIINECLLFIEPLSIIVESDFKESLMSLEKIRANRMIDKILWTTRNK